MRIAELAGEDAQTAIAALNLIDKLGPVFIVEEEDENGGAIFRVQHEDIVASGDVMNILISEDAVEVIKGLTFVLCVTISAFLCNGQSPVEHFKFMRTCLDEAAKADSTLDVSSQYDVLDILEATEGSSSGFYLKTYGLLNKQLGTYHASISLASLFYSICLFDLGRKPQEITDFLFNIIADWKR